uniref:Gluconeogenesis factor n=1 Tax=Aegilops tauschii subsp. strangulata TaxID=200361 RepID=A0A453F1W8_AEGTS
GEREGESARIPVARCLMRCGRGCSFLRPGVHPMPLLATPPYITPRTSAATAGPATATSSGTCSLRVRLRAPGRSAASSSSRLPRAMAATGADAAAAPPSLLVFSGGTAFNGVVEELKKVTTRVAHVLPVSDDGGSTAEIVRVLGGPAVGDIRSRCLRLSDESTLEALSVRRLLGHRLPLDPSEAKLEYHIVEGEHSLWDGVSRPYRETIRAFLVYFHNEILRRPVETFCFTNGSIGNFFFAGARIFFQSLDAAIFLFSRVSQIPAESLVLPVISTNDRLTLGCELWDGTIIRGQNEISHPSNGRREVVDKDCNSCSALPSSIKRVFYMSSEGCNLLHEVFPEANHTVLEQLSKVDCIVYAMGSLFTSVCPSLVLRGIGETIASRSIPKVLLLNGSHDRETIGLSASGFVTAITDSLNRTYGDPDKSLKYHPKDYVNAILVPEGGQIPLDVENLASKGIFHVLTVKSVHDTKVGVIFDPVSLIQALTGLISEHMDARLAEPDPLTENVTSVC